MEGEEVEPLGRYYLFYAPHDEPGGIFMAYSDSLFGPWTEYGDALVQRIWGANYTVSHVSSGDVVWNSTYGKYFMYFHGDNYVTRYATSTDMINWEYGGICVVAKDFNPIGNEASYARVFEHEIPGLGNKCIMTAMVNDSTGVRKIYYAHSVDGISWTAETTPLVVPDNSKAPAGTDYKANLSGAYFWNWECCYYIIAHGSDGNMHIFEVGESLTAEKHWGGFYDSLGVRNTDDELDDAYSPDYGRAGAPIFIQDDDGVWHMFYEAGKRLHANIVHAVQVFSVEFNTNGGTLVASLDKVPGSLPIEAPLPPANDGYTFGGWWKDSDFTTKWNF
jgi:hypothetical protein